MRLLILCLLIGNFATAQTSVTPLDCVEPFYHGVASGDPLHDRVIIWTRVTPDDFSVPVPVSYRMATDTAMNNVVAQGSMLTDASRDYTVKFDVTGLTPDTYYYFEFEALQARSARGRTKTAPTGNIDSLRFAFVSCANLESGYFNAYDVITDRNDIEAVLMLGDYIYEYEEGGYAQDPNLDRVFDPSHETITLDDYRLRYSVYHMDRGLQRLHQNYPWICVWDDHESANDAYENGAENHNLGEGLWSDRKVAAQRAYFEWLPIREKAPNNYEIYREFAYGDLLDLFMVDTRLQGRDEQGVNVNDPNRTLLGSDQYNWLIDQLDSSTAQWKILGNQVVFAPITVFGIPINNDAWDGYPEERQKVLQFLDSAGIDNFTVITGDVHTSWAFNLEDNGTPIGVEFVTPSVTSPGAPINGGSILMIENPHLEYVELTEHGFVILDINQQRIQADWFFINTISSIDDTYSWETSYYSNSGAHTLIESNSASIPADKYDVTLAPLCPRPMDTGGSASLEENNGLQVIGIYPNPASDLLHVHFATVVDEEHTIELMTMSGQIVQTTKTSVNSFNSTLDVLDISDLPQGMYFLKIETSSGLSTVRKFQKIN